MKKKIVSMLLFLVSFCFFIFPSSVRSANKFYNINLSYDGQHVRLVNVLVRNLDIGVLNKKESFGDFSYELVSFNGSVLEYGQFSFVDVTMVAPEEEDVLLGSEAEVGRRIPKKTTLPSSAVILISYFEDGDKVRIYDNKKELKLEIDISLFSVGCGNKKCEDEENYKNCPKDCQKQEEVEIVTIGTEDVIVSCGNKKCEDEENYKNCPEDCQGDDIENKRKRVIMFVFIIVFFVLVSIVLFIVLKKNNNK